MTAQEAAYECMQRVTRRIGYEHLTVELVETVEREFTEIISQVTPPQTLGEYNARKDQALAQLDVCQHAAAIQRWQRDHGWLPQEIEEPQPKAWWKRWLR